MKIKPNYKHHKLKNTLPAPEPFEGSSNSVRYFASLAFNSPKWYSVAEIKLNENRYRDKRGSTVTDYCLFIKKAMPAITHFNHSDISVSLCVSGVMVRYVGCKSGKRGFISQRLIILLLLTSVTNTIGY